MVQSPCYMVHGPWSMVHGPWSMVHDPLSMVHGALPMVYGPLSILCKAIKLRGYHKVNVSLYRPIKHMPALTKHSPVWPKHHTIRLHFCLKLTKWTKQRCAPPEKKSGPKIPELPKRPYKQTENLNKICLEIVIS